MATAAQVRVFLRPLGSPLTIGMSGLAVASFVQSGLDLHWVPQSQTRDVGLILLSVPFVLQLIATVVAYIARDGATGATVGLLSTSWLSIGLLHLASGPGSTNAALGLLLLIVGVLLVLSAVAVSVTKPLPAGIFALAAARFALTGIYELSAVSFWKSAAGLGGLLVTLGAGYCVLAFELEDQRHRPVLPTLRRRPSSEAGGSGGLWSVDGLEQEAGIRRSS